MVCVDIIHTKQLLYYQTSSFSGLGRHTSYDWQATAKKRSPSMQDAHVRRLLWLLFTYSGCGTYSQATPGLLNACVTVCDEFASRQLSVSRSWTMVFSIYLILKTSLSATEDAVVHLDTFWISCSAIAPVFGGEYCD